MNTLSVNSLAPEDRRRLLELAKAANLSRMATYPPALTPVERNGKPLEGCRLLSNDCGFWTMGVTSEATTYTEGFG